MISLELSPQLIIGGLAVPLIGALGLAIRRSTRRQESARLRDQLVDAARAGELDVADWRVFSLIDWLDQVATTGRTGTPGRHAPDRPAWTDSLTSSLAATLLPRGTAVVPDPFWPAGGSEGAGPAIRAAAVRYRERHQQRLRIWRRSPPRPRPAVTGRAKPVDALVPVPEPRSARSAGPVPGGWAWPEQVDVRTGPVAPVVLPSLVEEIFAVAGSGR